MNERNFDIESAPLVSVVIPTYNSESTIVRALESCVQQTTNEPIELLLVDDCSGDNTLTVATNYLKSVTRKNFSYKILPQKKNSGPAAVRNIGIKESAGKFIAFLDSDDYWAHDKLKFCLLFLAKQPNIDLVGHAYVVQGETSPTYPQPTKKISTLYLLTRNPIATPTIVFRSSKKIYFRENMRFAEDHDFLLRFSVKNCIYRIQVPTGALTILGRPILSAGGQSANRNKMRLGEMFMLIEFCRSNPLYFPILPLLLVLSLLKHLRQLIKEKTNGL